MPIVRFLQLTDGPIRELVSDHKPEELLTAVASFEGGSLGQYLLQVLSQGFRFLLVLFQLGKWNA